jgi:outer membrane receptor protein involved in Fe transport
MYTKSRSSVCLCRPAAIVILATSLDGARVFAADETQPETLQEIVVTATRREESLSRVPISVAAFTQQQMDAQGLKQIDDLQRFTPGLVLTRIGNSGNQISIRGISSGAGAGTTGVYIDDTPIQVRNLGYSSGTAFPALFDLERVEVLRGPQGTLFGAGSEGGTIRFIQTKPNLTKPSDYTRAEVSFTDGGDPSYEIGEAFGAPIVQDRLGFRISAFYRRDGGYIDGVSGTPVISDPAGDAGPASLTFSNVHVTRRNTNWVSTVGARAALTFAPTDGLQITPSVSYQQIKHNDGFDVFYPSLSSGGEYARPVFDAGNPATNPQLTGLQDPNTDFGKETLYLPALAVEWAPGPVKLVSNTSYFDRKSDQYFDFTQYYLWFYDITADAFPRPGDKASSLYHNSQYNFVQELRVQSNDASSRFNWVAGAFFSDSTQVAMQDISVNFLANAPTVGWFFLPDFLRAVTDGPPFGPGHSAFENWFGVTMDPASDMWSINFRTRDRQLAGFAQGDYNVTEKLRLTAGLRVSNNKLDFAANYASPENNQNSPVGTPGPVLSPSYSSNVLSSSEHSVTPKFGISYQLDNNNLFYTTAAKGFRPGGASQKVPITCNQDLIDFGYVDAAGNPKEPASYKSDNVWSFELGSKNRLFEERLVVDASVYHIKWSNIQTPVMLTNCAEQFVANFSNATSQGFDASFQVSPMRGLSVMTTWGYNRSRFGADGVSPGGVMVVKKDGVVPNSPPSWVYSVSGQYDFRVMGDTRMYLRADWSGNSRQNRVGQTDPNAPNYNPDLSPVASYSQLNARFGIDLFGADVSLFANNLTNAHPDLALANNNALTGLKRWLWNDQTLRPRTIGLLATYRY